MKWARIKTNDFLEYSNVIIGTNISIAMSHTSYNNHFWYTYSVNGEDVVNGAFDAENWDEAEQIVLLKIRKELAYQAELWNERLINFDKEMSASEDYCNN